MPESFFLEMVWWSCGMKDVTVRTKSTLDGVSVVY